MKRPRVLRQTDRQRGLSLIELMVSLAISLLLLAGFVSLFVRSNENHAELAKAGRQSENGRYAMQLLRDDLQHAGFYGQLRSVQPAPTALPDPCTPTPDISATASDLAFHVQGYDAADLAPLDCLPNFKPNTDVLVIRRASTGPAADIATLDAGRLYLQANSTNVIVDVDDAPSPFNLPDQNGIAPIRQYITHVYFISPCSVCDGDGDGISTLKRRELTINGGAPDFVSVPLVEGIEELQVDYGIDLDNNKSPDVYRTLPANLDEWQNVVTARISLLARNIEPTQGYEDTKSYAMGTMGTVGPFNNGYKRHAYSSVVRLVNPSSF